MSFIQPASPSSAYHADVQYVTNHKTFDLPETFDLSEEKEPLRQRPGQASVSSQQLPAEVPVKKKPHIYLHFDINQTIIFGDVSQGKSSKDSIVDALTDEFTYRWDPSLPEPITYNAYVKDYLLPVSDPKNKEEASRINALQKEKLCNFVNELPMDHPLYQEVQDRYQECLMAHAAQKGKRVFNSFYNLLDDLEAKGISNTLILRTFGQDSKVVADELNETYGSDFLLERNITKYKDHNFADPQAFHSYLMTCGQHLALRDNYDHWNGSGRASSHGKPFPISENRDILSLFFDDNARVLPANPHQNAVAPFDMATGKPITPQEAIERNLLFPVDPLQALSDPQYFIKLVDQALEKNQ